MIGSKDYDCILIQSQFFQCRQNLSESTVYTGNRGKVVANALCFFTLLICIGTDKKAVQRLIFVQIEIFFHTIIQWTIRTVGRIHTHHYKERFLRITYIPFVLQIRNHHLGLMQRWPFFRIVTISVRIPVTGILMFIKSTVGVPVIKAVTAFFRRIGIPGRYAIFYIVTGTLRIVRCREVSV